MKKTLQATCGMLFAVATLQAAAPEGNMYIIGLNGDDTPSDMNCLMLGERDEDDIEEGIWRWQLPEIELTAPEGSFTITDGDVLKLGFDSDNIFGITNNLTPSQGMIYLTPDGPAVNYNLPEGVYQVYVALFEDLEGDMGGDTWMVQIKSLSGGEESESIYLLGFNDFMAPSAACRFGYSEFTEDGETYSIYSLPRYYISECDEGFTVYDERMDAVYGQDEAFAALGDVTDENPMAFLAAGGEPVKCTLIKGYYDVNLNISGAMTMVSFIRCEDQTPQDELAYYLVGVDGNMDINDSNKFTRTAETGSYVDEETGETIEFSTVTYSLTNVEVKAPCELTVVAQDEAYVFGYNSDMAAFLPNDLNVEMPFASLVAGGEPVNCTLAAGKYDFTFSIAGVNMGMISALPAEEGAVDSISGKDVVPVYYNLHGVRVANPKDGIFIKVEGDRTSKVVR